jgi:hypothetical protein
VHLYLLPEMNAAIAEGDHPALNHRKRKRLPSLALRQRVRVISDADLR